MKKKFNFLNLFYGIGAVIILVAAAFKFLGWRHADIWFVVGIFVEALVFLLSAFDWGGKQRGYEWEKVFPQLSDEERDNLLVSSEIAEGTQQQQIQKIMETIVSLNNSVNELNAATKKLTGSVGSMEDNYNKITVSTQKYQEELDRLRTKLTNANDKLRAFDNFNIQNQKGKE